MEIFNKILHSYAIYYRKEVVKIFKFYLIPKQSYDTLSKGAIFFGQPCICRKFPIHIGNLRFILWAFFFQLRVCFVVYISIGQISL